MIKTIIISPFSADNHIDEAINICYARLACADALAQDEAPYASHLLYTQPGILDDKDSAQRELGFRAAHAWFSVAERSRVYVDLGISGGMRRDRDAATAAGIEVVESRVAHIETRLAEAVTRALPYHDARTARMRVVRRLFEALVSPPGARS